MVNEPFHNISRQKEIREQVYTMVRQAILKGLLRPEERLVETRLAELLGTSRTPVREALHKLELEGLVRRLPSRGMVVSNLSRDEVSEIFGIRRALECYAIGLAAERITNEELVELRRICARSTECLGQAHVDELIELNSRFHEVVNQASGSSRLVDLINTLREKVMIYRRRAMRSRREREGSTAGHKRLLRALRQRNVRAAEQLMGEHIEESFAGVIATLQDFQTSA